MRRQKTLQTSRPQRGHSPKYKTKSQWEWAGWISLSASCIPKRQLVFSPMLFHCPPIECDHPASGNIFLTVPEIYMYVHFNRSPLAIFKIPLSTLWQSFEVYHIFVQSYAAFSLEMLILPIAPNAVLRIYVDRIQHWAVVVCKLSS